MLRIKFQTAPGARLRRLQREVAGGISVDSLLKVDGERWLVALTAHGVPERTFPGVDELENVRLLHGDRYAEDSGTISLLVFVENVDSCIVQTLGRRRAIPHTIRVTDESLEGTVTVEDWDHLQTVADEIESSHESFELVSVTKVDHVDAMLGTGQFRHAVRAHLSEARLRTLERAFRAGYFTVPQDATAADVAMELDISQSTFSERVRRSVDDLLAVVFGNESDGHGADDEHE